jgi:hypothetical protein
LRRIPDGSLETDLARKPENEWAEADTLYGAAYHRAQT